MIGLFGIYLLVAIAVFAFFAKGSREEPTAHGRGVLSFWGSLLAVFWPLAAAWFLILSPWLVWRWLKGLRE
ncbi:hypothetical protein [uncultured Roseibium sp.]|uniref:hypothetical protein n=1 Tax=uncultured Roseibium sp. TaxID=1936171 RepID=UPI00321730DB